MGQKRLQWSAVWAVARNQHAVVTRRQLLDLGFGSDEIQYRIERKRLHPVWRGVYALGRPDLTRHGKWMAAATINAADKRDLIDPETLRSALDAYAGRPGVAALRNTARPPSRRATG